MVENVRLKYEVEASADKIKELEHEILVMHLRGSNQQQPPPAEPNANVDNEIPEQDAIDIEALEYDEQQAAGLYTYNDNAFPRSPIKSPLNGNFFSASKKKETPAMTGLRAGFTIICNKMKDAENAADVSAWELRDELSSNLTVT